MYNPTLNEKVLVTRPSGKTFEAVVIGSGKNESGIFITIKDNDGITENVNRKRISKLNK